MIQLTGIHKTYGQGAADVEVLKGVSLTVPAGERCAVMGASGSGKSTLLNIIGLLDRPTAGTYTLDGLDAAGAGDGELADFRNRKIGFVFQAYHLLPRLSALDNVAHPLLYRGMGLKVRRSLAREELGRVGLADRAHHLPEQLSGGQKQRAAIARALVGGPALILADEPTGNLDSQAADEIMMLLERLNQDLGVTVIIVTHDADVARRCGRVITICDGVVSE